MKQYSKILISGTIGSIFLSLIAPAAAMAAETDSMLYASSSKEQGQCLDTSTQEETNNNITKNRVVFPKDKGTYKITSKFGPRLAPVPGAYNYHYGNDLKGGAGTPIYAAMDGEVFFSDIEPFGGQLILIKHDIDGEIYYSRYNHLIYGSQKVHKGDLVKAGDLIGSEGTTGLSTGYHLHFEILKDEPVDAPKNAIDSLKWLKTMKAGYRTDPVELKSLSCEINEVVSNPNSEWGGYNNGEVAPTALKALSWAETYKLEKKAAERLESLNKAFKKKFKKNLPIVRAYADLKTQEKDSEVQLTGQSFYGWGKSIELDFTNATNDFIPLISEPNFFTDPEYKWLKKNAAAHDWVTLEENQEKGATPNPRRWVYNPLATQQAEATSLRNYAKVVSGQNSWKTDENRSCMTSLFNSTDWDVKYNKNNETGIGALNATSIKKYSTNPKTYGTDGKEQIRTALAYITAEYKEPCKALETYERSGKY